MCKSQPTDNKLSLLRTWSGHVTITKIFGAPIMQTDRFSRFKKIIIPYIIYKVINLISVRTYSKTVHNITRTK